MMDSLFTELLQGDGERIKCLSFRSDSSFFPSFFSTPCLVYLIPLLAFMFHLPSLLLCLLILLFVAVDFGPPPPPSASDKSLNRLM